MRKSEYVCSRIRQRKGRKRFILHLTSEKDKIKYKHAFKLCDGIRPERRINLWKAMILLDGHRSWHDKECI